jgi:DNA polymerase/3'-5' exonuclease PolX
MKLQEAKAQAEKIVKRIRRYCDRVEIDGSIRREKPEPRDIEIVAIPANRHLATLRKIVNNEWGVPVCGEFPSKHTRIRGILDIDFFWCDKETWGLNYFIRCGSREYVAGALAHWKKLSGGGYSKNCRLHLPNGVQIFTPEESDVFDVLQREFVRPCDRTCWK